MIETIDHTNKKWLRRRKQTNGAETYSKELVQWQVSKWTDALPSNSIISTCPRFSSVNPRGRFDVAIQYLHEFPYTDPVGYVKRIAASIKAKILIFITAYQAFETLMRANGLNAVFIPMSIDVESVKRFRKPAEIRQAKRILWFGNVDKHKRDTYNQVKDASIKGGYTYHCISREKYNGKQRITQEQAWSIASQYEYGIAVGRCALELFSLGLKVLIAGRAFGGLAYDARNWSEQINTNFNTRYWTYSNDIAACLEALPASEIGQVPDIREMNHAEMVVRGGYSL